MIAVNQNYLDNNGHKELLVQIDEIGKMLNSFIFSIERKFDE
jgi:hypothetical protein